MSDQPYAGLPVQFNCGAGEMPSGATIAAGLITGVNANGTVNVRGFVDRGAMLLQRPDLTFQDAKPTKPSSDLKICWPAGA